MTKKGRKKKKKISRMDEEWSGERNRRGRASIPVNQQLKVMAAACPVDGIDSTWVFDVLHQAMHLIRGIVGEAGKGSLLPKASDQVSLSLRVPAQRTMVV